jgi:hypothetical protein
LSCTNLATQPAAAIQACWASWAIETTGALLDCTLTVSWSVQLLLPMLAFRGTVRTEPSLNAIDADAGPIAGTVQGIFGELETPGHAEDTLSPENG